VSLYEVASTRGEGGRSLKENTGLGRIIKKKFTKGNVVVLGVGGGKDGEKSAFDEAPRGEPTEETSQVSLLQERQNRWGYCPWS